MQSRKFYKYTNITNTQCITNNNLINKKIRKTNYKRKRKKKKEEEEDCCHLFDHSPPILVYKIHVYTQAHSLCLCFLLHQSIKSNVDEKKKCMLQQIEHQENQKNVQSDRSVKTTKGRGLDRGLDLACTPVAPAMVGSIMILKLQFPLEGFVVVTVPRFENLQATSS